MLLGSSTSYCHIQTLVQRHKVLRRPPSVGMPRHALRRRMPKIAPSAVTTAVAARWSGHLPTSSGRVGRDPLPAPQTWKTNVLGDPLKKTISKPTHTILLKFCMRLQNSDRRTNPYYHFSGYSQNVGQK